LQSQLFGFADQRTYIDVGISTIDKMTTSPVWMLPAGLIALSLDSEIATVAISSEDLAILTPGSGGIYKPLLVA